MNYLKQYEIFGKLVNNLSIICENEFYSKINPIWREIYPLVEDIEDKYKNILSRMLFSYSNKVGSLPVNSNTNKSIYIFRNGDDLNHIIQCKDDWWILWTRNRDNSDTVIKCDQWDGLVKLMKDNNIIINLYSLVYSKYKNNRLHNIENGNKYYISLDKSLINAKISGVNRVYYILFKEMKDKNNESACLKLAYNLNTRHKNNFKIYDNYDNELDFDMLQTFLMRNGLTYGDFNAAWFYIEEDFNNKSYS